MREFARRWLGSADDVEFVRVTSGDRIPRLLAEDVDLLAATMTHCQERDAVIDFSQTYYLDGQNILVRADAADWPTTDAARIQLLDGKRIAAIEGSTSWLRIQEFARENAITIEMIEFEQYAQAIQPLLNDDIDAITTDRGILAGLALNNPELTILLDQNFSNEPYRIGVRSGDAYFADQVNYTLQEMKADGAYDDIYQQWFCATLALREECNPYPLEILPGAAPYTFTTAPISLTMVISGASMVDKLIAEGFFEAGVKDDAPTAATPTEPTVTPLATLEPTATASPEPTATVAMLPTATSVPVPTATPVAAAVAAPTTLPVSGISLRNVGPLPWISLIIILLGGIAIYCKRNNT